MFSATKVASISGLRISTMLRCTSPPVMSCRSRRSFSMSAPFLPMTTPGRAVWIEMRAFLAGRSMMILETPAWVSRLRRYARIRKSSCSSAPYPASAYQRDSQVRLIPNRRPIGLTF